MWTDQCSGNDDAAAAACSEKCALEGASDDYESVYGIRTDGNSLNLTCTIYFFFMHFFCKLILIFPLNFLFAR